MSHESNEARNKRRARQREDLTRRVSKQLKELINNEYLLNKTIIDILEDILLSDFKNHETYYKWFQFKLILKLPIGTDTYSMGKTSYNVVRDNVSKQFNISIKPILDRMIALKAFW